MVEGLKDVFKAGNPISLEASNIDLVLREMRLPHLLAAQFSRLQRPYGDSEIRTAMFSIDNSRSPGPNEYSSAFLKQNWETVGDILTWYVKQCVVSLLMTISLKSGTTPS